MTDDQWPTLEGDWYLEFERSGFVQGVSLSQRLVSETTRFQRLEVVESKPFGRVLILDDAFQTSEGEEFMYHEMLVHVPLMTHPAPRRVLIIGGGDGGTLRRVLQHPETEPVQVEIDERVIASAREYLPAISSGAFDNPRARIHVGDGVQYLRENPGQFDVVIVDSTDPIGPAVDLFRTPFYQDVHRSLADDGILVAQSSSPLFMANELRSQVENLRPVFPLVRTYLGIVPGYPGSLWSYTIASRRYDPTVVTRESIERRLSEAGIETRYYTPDVHFAAFVLPRFVADILA